MNAAEKGELYARIFRKVGVFLGKGEIPRALKELNEGMKIAERNSDSKMAARFAQEIGNISKTAEPTK
jgi:excinuclease UvrABC nuclease subunit